MKKTIKTKVAAIALSSVMVLPVALGACTPKGKESSDEWTITLNYNDGGASRNGYIYVDKEGGTVKLPDDPVRDGFSFAGWYDADEGGNKVELSTLTTADTTVYAHWSKASYTVSFDWNYEEKGAYETTSVEYGSKVTAPATDPTRPGYVFRYWVTAPEATSRVDFSTYTVERSVTFYARWRDENIKVYDVTLDYNNGTGEKVDYEVEEGKTILRSDLQKATKKGYTLVGYSKNKDASPEDTDLIKVNAAYKPSGEFNEPITLYAVWQITNYVAVFRYNYYDNPENPSNSAAEYSRVNYHYLDKVNAPETDPTRDGYTFEGWYTLATNNGLKVEFPIEEAPDNDGVYYAHWKVKNVYTDIFDAEYTEFDPNLTWPGYSGGAKGNTCISPADVSGVRVDDYPINSKRKENTGFYVTYQYLQGSGLTFEFYATEDITGASLIANWAVELAGPAGAPAYMEFGPTGDNAYEIALDGTPLNYTPALVGGPDSGVSGQYKGNFAEYTLMTGLNISAGKHTITLIPRNNNKTFGGVLESVAPMTDYIRISYSGSGKLYWNPVYDNLDDK